MTKDYSMGTKKKVDRLLSVCKHITTLADCNVCLNYSVMGTTHPCNVRITSYHWGSDATRRCRKCHRDTQMRKRAKLVNVFISLTNHLRRNVTHWRFEWLHIALFIDGWPLCVVVVKPVEFSVNTIIVSSSLHATAYVWVFLPCSIAM